jgi:3-phenylpropionate/trans-cinnamate dioxygenase ferredoxin subunit
LGDEAARSGGLPGDGRQPAWHRVPVALPPPGESRAFELRSRKLLLCNAGGTAYVIENACPHVRVSLEGGAIEGTVLECPHHGGRLDLRDGRPLRLPIRRGVATFAVRSASDGTLEVAIPAPASPSFPIGASRA